MSKRFAYGEYVWTTLDGETEMVCVHENHGPARLGSSVDEITVRFLNSEETRLVSSTALNREHPKATAAKLVRHAAGR